MTAHVRYVAWLDFVADLMWSPLQNFPRSQIADRLAESFAGCHVSWHWLNRDGTFGFELREPIGGFPPLGAQERWGREGLPTHPLLRWYAITGDPRPMTIGRVPRDLVGDKGFRMVDELLGPFGVEQQLSIPYFMSPRCQQTFVISRGHADFSDGDLELARGIQPLLAVLERHVTAVTGISGKSARAGVELTERELAVLGLLRNGMTATAIGHNLLVSERTVHAHLRSIYRKLGVSDRMRAVLVAQDLRLFEDCQAHARMHPGDLRVHWSSPTPAQLPKIWAMRL